MMTGQMRDRPKLSWTTEPGALYTVVLSDEALEAVLGEGNDYIHWVVTNIPGNDIKAGSEMFQFIQPWVAQSDSEKHPYLALVFKQRGKVRWDILPSSSNEYTSLYRMEEWQKGCSPSVLPPTRVLNKQATFVDKYGMELVAGTWFQVMLQLFCCCFVNFCGQVLYEVSSRHLVPGGRTIKINYSKSTY